MKPKRMGREQAVAERIRNGLHFAPALGFVLGSGFGGVLRRLEIERTIPYAKIPGFLAPTVPGHHGELLLGRLVGVPVAVLSGRSHYYEGHDLSAVTFPVRVLAALGIKDLLLTNAAGGIHPKFQPGDFMCLRDHINGMGTNPLRGPLEVGQNRFVDLTSLYDVRLRRLLTQAGRRTGVRLHEGVYLAVSGPSYETPAEIRAFRRMGADAVGMSTVPEAIVARQCGMAVAAVSCITNLAAGLGTAALSHKEVLDTLKGVQRNADALLYEFAKRYGQRATT